MEFVEGIRETWQNPNMRHAAVVHFPIVLSMLGLVMAILSAIWGGRNATLRWGALVAYAALALAAWMATSSGELAESEFKPDLATAARELIHEHEELGDKVWIFAVGTLALGLLTLVKKRGVRTTGAWLCVLGAAATAGWVGATAQHGGEAVYKYGAGTAGYVASAAPATGAGAGRVAPYAAAALESATEPRLAFFREHVRPVIDRNCLRCHDQVKHKAGLVQTSVAGLLKGGESGPAIVPGKPDESLMYRKITHPDEDEMMPPDGRLPQDQIAVIERWIREGAVGD